MSTPLVYIEWSGDHSRERIVRYDETLRPVYEYLATNDRIGGEVWRMVPCGTLPQKMAELIVSGWSDADADAWGERV